MSPPLRKAMAAVTDGINPPDWRSAISPERRGLRRSKSGQPLGNWYQKTADASQPAAGRVHRWRLQHSPRVTFKPPVLPGKEKGTHRAPVLLARVGKIVGRAGRYRAGAAGHRRTGRSPRVSREYHRYTACWRLNLPPATPCALDQPHAGEGRLALGAGQRRGGGRGQRRTHQVFRHRHHADHGG